MSKDLNQCNFIGRLGKDPDIRYMPSGGAVANFSIACGDDYKDKNTGQKVEKTNWINIVAFNRLAEIIGEYLTKGSKVFISGKQTTRKWQDNDGQDRYSTEIVASEMQMLDSRGGADQSNSSGTSAKQYADASGGRHTPPAGGSSAGADDFDDDIPF